jgi:hypothetical protein
MKQATSGSTITTSTTAIKNGTTTQQVTTATTNERTKGSTSSTRVVARVQATKAPTTITTMKTKKKRWRMRKEGIRTNKKESTVWEGKWLLGELKGASVGQKFNARAQRYKALPKRRNHFSELFHFQRCHYRDLVDLVVRFVCVCSRLVLVCVGGILLLLVFVCLSLEYTHSSSVHMLMICRIRSPSRLAYFAASYALKVPANSRHAGSCPYNSRACSRTNGSRARTNK